MLAAVVDHHRGPVGRSPSEFFRFWAVFGNRRSIATVSVEKRTLPPTPVRFERNCVRPRIRSPTPCRRLIYRTPEEINRWDGSYSCCTRSLVFT